MGIQKRGLGNWQISLGMFLLLVLVAGSVAGWYGPQVARWWRQRPYRPRAGGAPPRPVYQDADPYYLEPAETPLD